MAQNSEKPFRRTVPWMLILAAAVGIAIRLHQLPLQIPADDEWHALSASQLSFGAILLDFGGADRCIPLAVFYKLVSNTVGLDEFLLRLPVLSAGIALLFLPWLLQSRLQRNSWIGAGWLLAVSPLLIYFSRYARPYSISMVLALLAAFSFYRWWTGGGRPWVLLYVFAAGTGVYFHLSVIFFVTAPLGYALLELWRKGQGRPFRELLAWAGAAALWMALLLGPPLLVHPRALAGKLSENWINPSTIDGALQLMAGSFRYWVVSLMAVLSIIGVRQLARAHPRAVRFALFLSAAQVVGVLATGPAVIFTPIVPVRYCLMLLPLALLAVAQASASAESFLNRRSRLKLPEGSLCALLALLLFWAGPLRSMDYHPNNWTNHALFNYTYNLFDNRFSYLYGTEPIRISPFYERLAEQPPESLLLLEAPWHCEWHFNHYPHLQYRHRQRMMIGFVRAAEELPVLGELPAHDHHFRFSSFAHLSEYAKIRRAGVDYVILHKDLTSEFRAPAPPIDMSAWISRYRSDFGLPVYEDDLLAVFRVK